MVTHVSTRNEGGYLRETFRGPRDECRGHARAYLDRYPKGGYATAVDGWRALDGGEIEFTMRRYPTAD